MQFDQYEQFPELVHGIFLRHGGYSQAPFESLNISFTSAEERYADVVRNRYLALQSLGIAHYPCATMWIIHSARVLTLNKPTKLMRLIQQRYEREQEKLPCLEKRRRRHP
jgi:copper oxidase (laccase) domain-containing protein